MSPAISEVRPIHLPGSSAMATVLQRTRVALATWAREWVTGWTDDGEYLVTLNIESAREEDFRSAQEFEGIRGANGCVWFRRAARDRLNSGRAVVGAGLMPHSASADDWIAGIAEQAWTARNHTVCEMLQGAARPGPAAHGAQWPASLSGMGSGAVKISCESLGLRAIADAGVWSLVPPAERKSSRLPALVRLDRAAQRARLHIEVMLGSVELELPKLMDLCSGDVLRLPTRLDQPLMVSCEGTPFARAVLGDAAGRKSVQITGQY